MKSKKDLAREENKQEGSSAQKKAMEITPNKTSGDNKQGKKKNKHSSSAKAAAVYRSPVNAVRSNTFSSGGGDSTGINNEFQEE